MSAEEVPVEEQVEMADGEEEVGGQDLFYVPEKALDGIKGHLSNGKCEEKIKPLLEQLTSSDSVADEEAMVPVDMRGVGQDFASVEDMLTELGVVGAAEAFAKAREYFEANHDGEAAEDRAQPITAAEWKAMLSEGGDGELQEGEEEELLGEGAEEEEIAEEWAEGAEEEAVGGEGEGEGEEAVEESEGEGEVAAEEGEGDEEPAAKKAKTDEE